MLEWQNTSTSTLISLLCHNNSGNQIYQKHALLINDQACNQQQSLQKNSQTLADQPRSTLLVEKANVFLGYAVISAD